MDGFGQILIILGILIFVVLFHKNLHTIEEKQPLRRLPTFLSFKSIGPPCIGLFICVLLLFLRHDVDESLLLTHIQILCFVTTLCICVLKYYISQNENLEFYVSIYHKVPAPVLPWQLPEDFDKGSVRFEWIQKRM